MYSACSYTYGHKLNARKIQETCKTQCDSAQKLKSKYILPADTYLRGKMNNSGLPLKVFGHKVEGERKKTVGKNIKKNVG